MIDAHLSNATEQVLSDEHPQLWAERGFTDPGLISPSCGLGLAEVALQLVGRIEQRDQEPSRSAGLFACGVPKGVDFELLGQWLSGMESLRLMTSWPLIAGVEEADGCAVLVA
jgi:hypothetical protein